MLATSPAPANILALPVAAVPLTPEARQALLPSRLGPAWRTARWLDLAVARLDLSCLAKLYRRCRGSWPVSPLLLLKLALFCLADGLPSPADWAYMANRDGPCRWLAWGIEPSVSACYAFRNRLGVARLFELNRQLLALALADRITPAKRGAIDGTTIEADASRHHLVNQRRLQQGLQVLNEPAAAPKDQGTADTLPQDSAKIQPTATALKANSTADCAAQDALPVRPKAAAAQSTCLPEALPQQPAVSSPQSAATAAGAVGQAPQTAAAKTQRRPVRPGQTAKGRARQRQRWQSADQQLQGRLARNQNKRASKRTDPDKVVISPTDPQAAIGRDKRGVFRPLYNAQLVADLDSDLILGYEVVAQPNDNGLLPVMLKRSQQLLGHQLDLALVDAGYTGGQELTAAEQADVVVLGPCAGQSQGSKKAKQLAKSEFVYDEEADQYVCPQGQKLCRVGQSQQKRSSVELVVLTTYRADGQQCQNCPLKQQCCPKSSQGRTISRSEHEGAIERLQERMSQPENKKLYKRRAATVERLFGDGKEHRGLQRVAGRGLKIARIQLALMVLQHNLRVLAKAMEAADLQRAEPPQERLTG